MLFYAKLLVSNLACHTLNKISIYMKFNICMYLNNTRHNNNNNNNRALKNWFIISFTHLYQYYLFD